jgi:hypothetical protein
MCKNHRLEIVKGDEIGEKGLLFSLQGATFSRPIRLAATTGTKLAAA